MFGAPTFQCFGCITQLDVKRAEGIHVRTGGVPGFLNYIQEHVIFGPEVLEPEPGETAERAGSPQQEWRMVRALGR